MKIQRIKLQYIPNYYMESEALDNINAILKKNKKCIS